MREWEKRGGREREAGRQRKAERQRPRARHLNGAVVDGKSAAAKAAVQASEIIHVEEYHLLLLQYAVPNLCSRSLWTATSADMRQCSNSFCFEISLVPRSTVSYEER
eukprot:1181278-Rhodomonas_salina.1